jgi:abequosyltransferase
MPDGKPLLTIAIPTYNRAAFLRELLEQLLPQIAEAQAGGHGDEIELLISDNAATDDTPAVTAWAQSTGIPMRVVRQTENIGSDRNFVFCFNEARGKYFWLFGDDDILRPGSLAVILQALRGADYDLVYLNPVGFQHDWQTEWQPDPYRREAQVVTSACDITLYINVGITFITGVIANRDRILELGAEPPANFVGTNLTQLSWTLPMLRQHRQSLVLWQRFVSGRAMNSGGYNVADVFGARFLEVVRRLLPDRPRLAAIFSNLALRVWFPATMVEIRQRARDGRSMELDTHGTDVTLKKLFGGNWRFWVFTWPALRLPLRYAELFLKISRKLHPVVGRLQMPKDTLWKLRSKRYS